jgi:hypothetical protein
METGYTCIFPSAEMVKGPEFWVMPNCITCIVFAMHAVPFLSGEDTQCICAEIFQPAAYVHCFGQ